MGQSIGPVFGGIISQYLGFRAIFWFLFGLSAATLLLIVLLLPETLRSIAGNDTIRLTSIHRPLIYSFSPPADELKERTHLLEKRSHSPSFLGPSSSSSKKTSLSLFSSGRLYTQYGVWWLHVPRIYSKTILASMTSKPVRINQISWISSFDPSRELCLNNVSQLSNHSWIYVKGEC